jgi:hypothetical protein
MGTYSDKQQANSLAQNFVEANAIEPTQQASPFTHHCDSLFNHLKLPVLWRRFYLISDRDMSVLFIGRKPAGSDTHMTHQPPGNIGGFDGWPWQALGHTLDGVYQHHSQHDSAYYYSRVDGLFWYTLKAFDHTCV